jgi:hypothetical protein
MFGINLKHSLATVAVAAGLLAAAGPASAGVLYNGHAGLGANAYQHNQTDLEFAAFSPQAPTSEGFWLGSNDALTAFSDGTSNTMMLGERAAKPKGVSIDIGTAENVASDGLGASDFVLMGDSGGQYYSRQNAAWHESYVVNGLTSDSNEVAVEGIARGAAVQDDTTGVPMPGRSQPARSASALALENTLISS